MTNIVGLRGQSVRDPRTPVKDVVGIAENVAEMARTGEIKGLTVAYLYWDDGTGYQVAGDASYGTVGRIEAAKTHLLNSLKK